MLHKTEQWLVTYRFAEKILPKWQPVICRSGDRHYPRDKALCDSEEIHEVPLTYEEIISAEPRQLNHMHVINAQKYQLACDYSPPHGHVLPTKLPNYLHRSLAPNFPECLEPKWFNFLLNVIIFQQFFPYLRPWWRSHAQGRNQLIFSRGAKWLNLLLYLTNTYVCENFGGGNF